MKLNFCPFTLGNLKVAVNIAMYLKGMALNETNADWHCWFT
jgi:hypothetical protein